VQWRFCMDDWDGGWREGINITLAELDGPSV
jgi:hypothetical protein